MASAIVRGCLSAPEPPVAASRWVVVVRSEERREHWRPLGVQLRDSIAGLAPDMPMLSAVILATKPQMLGDVTREASEAGLDFTDKPLVSVLAGVRIQTLRSSFAGTPPVIRAMPNTPLRVGLGLTALCSSDDVPRDIEETISAVFSAAGRTMELDEDLFDAFTALAGSGPAYLFYLAQAMEEAALRIGFDDSQAREIVRATLLGSATLLDADGGSPANLRAAVTSKSGTTDAATSVLDEHGVLDAITRAIVRGRDRGRELADR